MTLPERQAWALRTIERLQEKAANVIEIRPCTPERENAASCFVIEFLGASDAIRGTESTNYAERWCAFTAKELKAITVALDELAGQTTDHDEAVDRLSGEIAWAIATKSQEVSNVQG